MFIVQKKKDNVVKVNLNNDQIFISYSYTQISNEPNEKKENRKDM
jgi:hypothetical protein